ncbi:MAG: SMC family ATPase, partial [Nocardioides sp.]|nr:SMC family ATPase [Nocardioides sp.]
VERREGVQAALRRTEGACAAALTRVATLSGTPTPASDVSLVRDRVAAARADLDRLRPGITEAAAQREGLSSLESELEHLDTLDRESEMRRQAIPDELDGVRAHLERSGEARLLVEGLTARTAQLRARHAAAARVAELAPRVDEAGLLAHETAQALVAAKERWLDVREARLEGMASEIASALVVGDSCPVCGSHDHPSPASPLPGAPDAAAEREARKVVDDLEATHEARRGHLRELEQALAVARAEAGPADDLGSLLAQATSDLQEAEGLAATEDGLRQRCQDLAAELSGLEAASTERRQQREGLRARTVAVRHTLDALDAEVAALLATWDCPDVVALEALLGALESACDAARAALSEQEAARAAAVEVDELAVAAALRAGFVDLEAASAALVPADEVVALTALVEEHDRQVRRVREELDGPVLRDLGDPPVPDVQGLEAEVGRAKARADHAVHELARLETRGTRLDDLRQELGEALATWLPVRRELDLVDSLTSFVEGRSGDNRLRMRLSAYVLAHRLAQVVAAANTRLWSMSSQRYTLIHTGRRGAGETRGGLSLLVRDEWSGESRDPATLSGGETFVVSLALALGLADVIGGEAGGGEVHTLFVDEGFGALDADTLDDVMDTLDGLRDGGRVVGVVSHVGEMQTRIPSQLRVHKGRQGSHATLHLG